MTTFLSLPTLPAPVPARDGVVSATPGALSVASLGARAVKPVSGMTAPRDLRDDEAGRRPAGPPPAFDVTILQDIRAVLRDPPLNASQRAEAEFARPPDEGQGTHELDQKL